MRRLTASASGRIRCRKIRVIGVRVEPPCRRVSLQHQRHAIVQRLHAVVRAGREDGDVLDEARVRKLSMRVAQQLTPYILAMRRRSAGIDPGSEAEAAEDGRQQKTRHSGRA